MKKILYTLVLVWTGFACVAQDNNAASSKPININTDFIEFSPTVSGDGKTMVFQSNRDGSFKLYESTLQPDGNWSSPKALDHINKWAKMFIGSPCLSQDGKTLYLSMFRGLDTDMDIYVAKKGKNDEWGLPFNIGKPITTSASETFPSISPDGKKLFYTLTTVDGKEAKCSKIMMSELNDRKNWTKPIEVAAPINASCDKSATMVYDNKTILFSSNSNGNYDLFRSEMSAPNSWSQPVALNYINSPDPEINASLTASEDYIYYAKKGDIYFAPVPDNEKLHGLKLEGEFLDLETGKPVIGKLFLVDSMGKDTLKR
ncbi:MAG TPA: hypothetical protein VK766_04975, partial [Cytophagaceae bacterium]|nr:hypothetical protein [Cytophagaceae bacterium]